jgi:hypothetical protein
MRGSETLSPIGRLKREGERGIPCPKGAIRPHSLTVTWPTNCAELGRNFLLFHVPFFDKNPSLGASLGSVLYARSSVQNPGLKRGPLVTGSLLSCFPASRPRNLKQSIQSGSKHPWKKLDSASIS